MVGPQRNPAQGALEVADGRHCHGIDHLLVELGFGLRWCQTVLRQELGIVEIDEMVEQSARRIDIDNFDVFSHRPWL